MDRVFPVEPNVYDNYDLTGTPIQVLKTNTKVEVLDELDNCCVVKVEEITGFMKLEDLSKYPIGSQSGGGGASGADGGNIYLCADAGIMLLPAIVQEGDVPGRADGTLVVLGYFEMEDIARIVVEPGFAEEWEGFYIVMMDDLYAHVAKHLVRTDGEEAYTQWDNTMRYDNFHLQVEGKRLNTNTPLYVIADLETCYLVSVEDETGYIAKEFTGKKQFVSSKPSGGGGYGGGGEWSDPVMRYRAK